MHQKPSLTVDGIAFQNDQLILIKRKNPPFQGHHALPGGFVEVGETVEQAVVREFLEETGLITKITRLLGVYSSPDRDPRGHTVSVVFELEVVGGTLQGGDDAAAAELFKLDKLPKLAFDHETIVSDYCTNAENAQSIRAEMNRHEQ
ncbi:MAG: NUDIX hydrolase [Thermoplasmata archaeon]|nr:NUDIX hydrolase [Thermoplasmata archaeon]